MKEEAHPQWLFRAQPILCPHLEGYQSESTAYIGSYPDGYPLVSLLKDGGSYTVAARSSPISGPHPDGYPSQSTAYIGSYPDGYFSESLLKDGS